MTVQIPQLYKDPDDVRWAHILISLSGGLCMFLYGMQMMSRSLRAAFGHSLQAFLQKCCANRIIAMLSGTICTAILSSSTAASVMVIGFVEADMVTFSQSLGVLLGVNIGTTLTAHLVAFNIMKYSLAVVTLGYVMLSRSRAEQSKKLGEVIFGLGLLFFGMKIMGDSMLPLKNYPPFVSALKSFTNPVHVVIVGALFTLVIQSSAAATGVIIVLAQQGFLTLQTGSLAAPSLSSLHVFYI